MKSFTRLKAALFMAAGLCFSVHAQIPDGTDLTDRIQNPSFESTEYTDLGAYPGDPDKGYPAGTGKREQPEGWVYESVMTGKNDVSSLKATEERKSADGVQHFNSWGEKYIYSNLSQTIEDLPAGAYKLTAAMRVTSIKYPEYITDQHIYGINSDGLIFNSPTMTLAGLGTNDSNWEYLEVLIIMKTSGSLTIGATSNGDADATTPKGWFQCDDFRLTYLGSEDEYGPQYYQALIKESTHKLLQYYDPNQLSAAAYKALDETLMFSEEHEKSLDLDILKTVIDSLNSSYAITVLNADAVLSLQDLINEIGIDYEPNQWEGFADLREVSLKSFNYFNNNTATNERGELINTEDVLEMVSELQNAIRTYRFKEPASLDAPADFTWALLSPQFTKKGGNTSLIGDASSEGWSHANNPATGSQYRLNNVGGKNCWNNYKADVISMNVFQDLENMPAGFYTFSCYQTNDGSTLTDQHAYITTVAGTSDSPYATYSFKLDPDPDKGDFTQNSKWEGPLETGRIFVGSDGKIRVGFASTGTGKGSSGWFCITDCVLTYYGMTDDAYGEALQNLIQSAEGLKDSVMLITTMNILEASIQKAKAVDPSDKEAAEQGLVDLNDSMTEISEAIQTLSTFKLASYGTALNMANNYDMVYTDGLVKLMKKVIAEQDILLESDTLTLSSLPMLTATIDQYLAYADSYLAYEEFSYNQYDNDILKILTPALEEQTENVIDDIENIVPAQRVLSNLMDFVTTYQLAITLTFNEEYPLEMLIELAGTCEEQLELVKDDYLKAVQASAEIAKVLGGIRFAGLGIEAGENTEVTDLVLANPTIESEGSEIVPEGWTIHLEHSKQIAPRNQHWTGDSNNRYLDSYHETPGKLKFTGKQTVTGIPNGTYRLVAAVRSNGSGAFLFADVNDGIKLTEIKINGDSGGNIWEESDVDTIRAVHSGKGYGWNWMEVGSINVNTHTMTIGCTNDPAISGTAWNGTWYSADDFKLFYTSTDFTIGVETIGMDTDSGLIAFAENGIITVVGAEEYTVYTLNGTQLPAHAKFAPGIYIVRAANKVTKVAVK